MKSKWLWTAFYVLVWTGAALISILTLPTVLKVVGLVVAWFWAATNLYKTWKK